MADPINQKNPGNQGPFDTTQGQGNLSNPDPYGSQDLAGNRTPEKNDTLYSISTQQRLDTNQDDQDLSDNPDTDDPDAANIDENDDQYDIQGGQGLYGTGDYGNQGGPDKPASGFDRYRTRVSQDQNGYQQ